MIDTTKDNSAWAIEAKGLTKYFSGRCVLDGISLRVAEGAICGLLGPNGAGKTSTMRLLCGLLTPDRGEGICLGYDIRKEAQSIKAQTGYMPQKFSLYGDLTPKENLHFIASMYNLSDQSACVQESMERFGIPAKYRDQLAGTLSGGWKQRLALAATMLQRPKLLLLDEPTAGVDPNARREFWEHIHALSEEGVTTLVSTHYMDEAQRCHYLAYLAQGHLLAEGSIDQLIAQADIAAIDVSGEHLSEMGKAFSKQPDIYQASQMGHVLHVSGANQAVLAKLMQAYKSTHTWVKTKPYLEDAFIYFIQQFEAEGAPPKERSDT